MENLENILTLNISIPVETDNETKTKNVVQSNMINVSKDSEQSEFF